MGIEKAAWRAFESVSEPGSASTWVWLGRSTPYSWLIRYRQPILNTDAPSVPGPWNPVFDPVIDIKDQPYVVTYDGNPYHTLAWDSSEDFEGKTYRWVIQQWNDDAGTWSLLNFREGTKNTVWLGKVSTYQHDARIADIRHSYYGHYSGSGVISTVNKGGVDSGASIKAACPNWKLLAPVLDMTTGAGPTSIQLNWS